MLKVLVSHHKKTCLVTFNRNKQHIQNLETLAVFWLHLTVNIIPSQKF